MKLSGYIRVPNWIMDDHQMYDSTKRVLFSLLACAGSGMTVRKSLTELSDISGCCRNTVIKAIRELEERGIVRATRRHYYSQRLERLVCGKNRYYIFRCGAGGAFTLVPRELLAVCQTHAQFVIALHAYRLAGRKGRCFPSLRLFARQIDHAKSTVCRGVKRLHRLQVIIRSHCRKSNRAAACNSYYPTAWVRGRSVCACRGGSKFELLPVNNKITGGLYLEEKQYGVGEFGILHNLEASDWPSQALSWDGIGIRVSAPDELDLLA